jgi:oligopeptide transport system substrate-binding protein
MVNAPFILPIRAADYSCDSITLTPMRHLSILLLLILTGCGTAWNDPYPAVERGRNILYSAFTDRPKHLDPVQSYSEDEITFTAQIYVPPLQYHYLRRPYQLIPATATAVPQPVYLDIHGQPLPRSAVVERIAFTDYVITLKQGILFQPHPAFALDTDGRHIYHGLTPAELAHKHVLADFEQRDSRELIAADYVYGLKRLAHPRLHSPILGLMGEYIVGLY